MAPKLGLGGWYLTKVPRGAASSTRQLSRGGLSYWKRCRKGSWMRIGWGSRGWWDLPHGVSYKGKPTYFHLERWDLGLSARGGRNHKRRLSDKWCAVRVSYTAGAMLTARRPSCGNALPILYTWFSVAIFPQSQHSAASRTALTGNSRNVMVFGLCRKGGICERNLTHIVLERIPQQTQGFCALFQWRFIKYLIN